MLPAGRHVLEVYGQVLGAAKPGTLLIDSSTIDVASARTAHDLGVQAKMLTLDAPVSAASVVRRVRRSPHGPVQRRCFEKAKPVLEAMGKKVVHCGDAGAGQAAKICNNMILVSAYRRGRGVRAGRKTRPFASGAVRRRFHVVGAVLVAHDLLPGAGSRAASPANNDYKPGFAAALMVKDLKLSQEAAAASGANTPMGALAAQLYGLFNASGEGNTDFSGIINMIRGQTK